MAQTKHYCSRCKDQREGYHACIRIAFAPDHTTVLGPCACPCEQRQLRRRKKS
jgi:hypothetical protein